MPYGEQVILWVVATTTAGYAIGASLELLRRKRGKSKKSRTMDAGRRAIGSYPSSVRR
jgi:hypothetical protein